MKAAWRVRGFIAAGTIAMAAAVFWLEVGGDHRSYDWSIRPAVITTEVPGWMKCGLGIAHGFGRWRGAPRTNSLEAFTASYDAGFRIFEVDLLWHQNALIASHDPPTRSAGELSIQQIVSLLDSHHDAWLVLDIKNRYRQTLVEVAATAQSLDPDLINRIVPQIYAPEDLSLAAQIAPWPTYILTLYLAESITSEIIDFAGDVHVPVVAIDRERFTASLATDLKARGVLTYVHTVNDSTEARQLRQSGVAGFFSDDPQFELKCSNAPG